MNKTKVLLSPFTQHGTKSLARTIRQEDEIIGIQIGKEEETWSLLTDNRILYVEYPKNSASHTKKNG